MRPGATQPCHAAAAAAEQLAEAEAQLALAFAEGETSEGTELGPQAKARQALRDWKIPDDSKKATGELTKLREGGGGNPAA